MKRAFLGTLAGLLAGAGLSAAQPPPSLATGAAPPPFTGSSYGQVVSPFTPHVATGTEFMPHAVPEFTPPCGDCPCWPDAAPAAPGRFWASAEYLLWWIKDTPLPPLVTTGPLSSAGLLGLPGTTVLFGGGNTDNDERSGARFRAGYWFDCCQTCGIEGGYFFLGSRDVGFSATCPPDGVLSRPFFNVLLGRQDAEVICLPGLLDGRFRASLASRLQGAEANFVKRLCWGCTSRVDFLAGFRFLELDEGLGLFENVDVSPNFFFSPLAGAQVSVFDQFDTRNRFYGGQLGARAEVWRGPFFVNLRTLVALGTTQQVIRIFGSTTIDPPAGPSTTIPAGLLALSTNSGRFERDRFAVVPEVNVNVGYRIAGGLRAFVGYTFLYWSDVVRPGDQIDPALNVTQIPTSNVFGPLVGPARPRVPFKETDFWAQGINFGLEWRY